MIPRAEFPKPQFQRKNWQNLNGQWQFEIDNGCSGEARGLNEKGVRLAGEITVPFCPESRLSGVQHKDFMFGVWYKRTVELEAIPEKVLLHFGAVDYLCKVFINGVAAGEHKGGYSSFAFDITKMLTPGENEIAVFAQDNTKDTMIPSGKQCMQYASRGCYYTRTTGIWQTVWLEFLPQTHIASLRYTPNAAQGSITVEADLCGCADFACQISFEGRPMGSYCIQNVGGTCSFTVQLKEKHLWDLGQGALYDVELTFGEDRVQSYFGLRDIRFDGMKFLLNGRSVFQRLVLDQGFYPDGIYTAPTDANLVRDIQLSMEVGFNGARLHEKVFEERFLYHADRLGYLVWGEYPDWGLNHTDPNSIYSILPEWSEVLKRDRNHPAIIGWCPHNETWDQQGNKQFDPGIALLYHTTKAVDPTRPCIDTSGNFHVVTDIYDVHDYNQDPVTFKEHYDRLMTEGELFEVFDNSNTYKSRYALRQHYPGDLPVFISEYGGIRWAAGTRDDERKTSWGYGKDVADEDEFFYRFRGLTDAILDNERMFALCYTQLTDVEQEQNGVYTYDRQPKFDAKRFRDILSRKAAIE